MENSTSTEIGNEEESYRFTFDKVSSISPGLALLRQRLGEKAQKEPNFRFYSLYAHICHIESLRTAWHLLRGNGQTPGVDGITYEDIEGYPTEKEEVIAAEIRRKNVETFLIEIQTELKNKTYKPMPVRRVYIPKPDGRKRPLGIPTIKDRLVQMATVLIIEPIFEKDFLDCSYGFRPGRSAHEAIDEINKNIKEGRVAIYDADLKGYFDSIPHDKLMKCIRMRVTDGSVLKLIESWLKAPIIEKEKNDKDKWNITVEKPLCGTPQGGVISPLLANIYLHWFDKKFHNKDGPRYFANARLVRYADDFVVMAKYISPKIINSIKHTIETWLGLEINEEKTKTVVLSKIGDSFDFLGFTYRVERSHYNKDTYIRIEPKKKAIQKAMDKVRELTSRSRNFVPIDEFIESINQFVNGWRGYFKKGHPDRIFRKMDFYIHRRVKSNLKRRSQRGAKPDGSTWYKHLKKKLGLAKLYDKAKEKGKRRKGNPACA